MGIPVVDHNNINLTLNTSISAADLFSTTDPDGDAIDFYLVEDYQSRADGGFFSLAGVAQTNGSQFRVNASDLSNLTYQAGSNPGTEGFRVIAFDVNGEFSTPADFGRINSARATNLVRPVVQDISASVLANEVIPVTDLLSAFDPDGFPITQWFIRDRNVDSSFLTFNGVAQQQGEYFLVRADELDQVAYHAFNGDTFGVVSTEKFDKFAYDGAQWSEFSTSEITTRPNVNHAVAQSTRTNVRTNTRVSLEPFSVVSDDDGNTIKFYEFRNTSPHAVHGDLILDGVVQPRQEWFRVSPEQLSENLLTFEGGETDFVQQIRFRGNDGQFTGISGVISIDNDSSFEVFSTPTSPGLIYDQQLESYDIGTLFPTVGDAGLVTYQFFDAASGAGASANFEFNATALAAGRIHTFSADQVANNDVVFLTGDDTGRSLDDVYVRALNDRGNWSPWERLTVRTEPEHIRSIDGGVDWLSIPGITLDATGRVNLSYSFMQSFPDYATGDATDGSAPNNFSVLNNEQRDAVRLAFDQFEAITNINFFEIGDSLTNDLGGQGGIWRFGNYGEGVTGTEAFAFPPDVDPAGGDIWFNRFALGTATDFDPITNAPIAFDDPTLTPGSAAFTTLLNEMMHALGYANVFENTLGSTILPADTQTDYFSVLSNLSGERTDGIHPTTPQLYDVEALQRIYGVNLNHNAGDTLYTLTDASLTGSDDFAISLWDGGGNDTFSLEGSDPSIGNGFANVVDLRAGGFSSVNGFEDNISIPLQAEIENAIGSDFADTLIGNHLGNSLVGGNGNDLIEGQSGDDLLTGGAGNDRFIFGVGDGSDVIDEQRLAGRDTIELAQFGTLDDLSEDLRFRLEGRDLIISLHLDDQITNDGTLRITNHIWGAYRIETLELDGTRIDLVDLAQQATSIDQKFELTTNSSAFGQLVAPV